MAIYKRGNVYWACIVPKGKQRVRVSLQTDDKDTALQREAELRLKLTNRRSKRDYNIQAPLLIDAIHRLIERYDDATAKTLRSHASFIVGHFGGATPIDQISEREISDFVRMLKAHGNSKTTINRKLSTLQTLLKTACYEWKVVHKVPHIKMFKEAPGRFRIYSQEEEAEILKFLKGMGEQDMIDLIVLLVDTGCRLSEALNLKCEDIGKVQQLVHIWKPKNKIPRSVPMTDRVSLMLDRRCKSIQCSERVFASFDAQHASYVWQKVRKALNMEEDKEATLHAWRHTTASRLVQAGVPLYTVQRFLGHSTIRVTERYAHLRQENLRQAADVLSRLEHPLHSLSAVGSPEHQACGSTTY